MRNINHIVIQLEDAPGMAEFFQRRDFIDRATGIAPLQDDDIRRLTLDFNDRRQAVTNTPFGPVRRFQLYQRLTHAVMANG